jgi:hypothetical protein
MLIIHNNFNVLRQKHDQAIDKKFSGRHTFRKQGSNMASLFLQRLSREQRGELEAKLHRIQNGRCFICDKEIDLELHKGAIDIDHVVPLAIGGKDDDGNFALTHASCNRSKQAANLEVARILQRFTVLKEDLKCQNRSPNLDDVLSKHIVGERVPLNFRLADNCIEYSLDAAGDATIHTATVYKDEKSGFRYFFAKLPIQYLRHDDKINPRSIGSNIGKLVTEFYARRPQLHISLAWIASETGKSAVHVFDGQHKAAAQIMLGVKELPIRVFIDPDNDILITTNTNAGTSLKQVAFDKSVQRHLGNTLYKERIARYLKETGKDENDLSFSELDLVHYYKGQSRELKKYILDAVRDSITSAPENSLRDFIDRGGRGKERPLSYSTIDKTFYSFFIYQDVLTTPLDYGLGTGENPRECETSQIIKLMSIIAEEIYIGKFDSLIGTDRIEDSLQKGENFPHAHLAAFRMSKEEVIYNWLRYVQQIVTNYFTTVGKPIEAKKLFQYAFPDQLWENIRNYVRNLASLPLWISRDLSQTVFGGKHNSAFWQHIFETGKSPYGTHVMLQPINLMELIKPRGSDA